MKISAAGSARLEVSGAIKCKDRLVRRPEICRSAEQPGDILRQDIEDLARGISSGDALRIGRKNGKLGIPSGRQLTSLHQVNLVCEIRIFRVVTREEFGPTAVGSLSARADTSSEVLTHGFGNQKFRVLRPSINAFHESNFLFAQRLAVRLA